jgi:hypothetical protein
MPSPKGLLRDKFLGDLPKHRHVTGGPGYPPLPGLGQGEISNVMWHQIASFPLSSGNKSGNAISITHAPEMALLASFPIHPITIVRLHGNDQPQPEGLERYSEVGRPAGPWPTPFRAIAQESHNCASPEPANTCPLRTL